MRVVFDNVLAAIGTIALHALLIWLLLVGVRWERPPEDRAMTTLKAVVVDASAFEQVAPDVDEQVREAQEEAEAALQREAEAERQREAEAQRQREAEAERQREAEAVRQREAEAERQREAEAVRQREAEAERQREAEAERQREAEAARQREAEAERQRQREAEERRRREAEERRRREAEAEAERQRQRERARQEALEAQLQAELAAEEAREGAVRDGLLAQYIELIRQKVERNWIRPASVPDGLTCVVAVRQLRNGEVVSVRVVECSGGEALIRSIEQAVLSASPLPEPPDASLFEPNLEFPFKTGE